MAYDVFLSYNSLDRPIVSRVAAELEQRGCTCFIDQSYLMPGRDWVAALEKALADSCSVSVFVGPREMGRWQQRECAWALDRQADDQRFAVIPVLLPDCEPPLGFLRQLMWIDLRQDPADATQLDALAAAIRGERVSVEGRKEPRATICPYRGLLYFREEDAAFFFGRDTYVDELAQKVEQRSLVAVVGASGSGKSSLVRAGLLPRLRSHTCEHTWEIITMVPGEKPLHGLADALMPLVEPELSGVSQLRQRNAVAKDLLQPEPEVPLADLVDAALKRQQGTDRMLLVVDQWEELYSQCEEASTRRRFISELLDATARKASPLTIILTVRSDFYGELVRDRLLLDRLKNGKLDLGPMNKEELHLAIQKPAENVGLAFQDGLVDRLLADAREEPGRLALLEFALEELWKRRDGERLTHAAYEDLGRINGAIATRAESVYLALGESQRSAIPDLFRRLVRAGSKTEDDTRRRASFDSLSPVLQRVARDLADERLLVTTREATVTASELAGDSSVTKPAESNAYGMIARETVEVAHEELLRQWDRLKQWIDEDRHFLQWRSRLTPSLEQFHRDPSSALLRLGALREARQFYPARQDELEDDERAFLSASIQAERRREIGLWSVIIATAAVLIGVILGVRAYNRQQADKSTVEVAVDNLPRAAAVDVPEFVEKLAVSPKYALGLLREKFAEEDDERAKLRLAFGLARVEKVATSDHDLAAFLFNQITEARPTESANLVQALSRIDDKKSVAETLKHRAEETGEPSIRTKYLTTALCLDEVEPAANALELRDNPQDRTDFIHNFAAWPGDLERLAAVLKTHDDPDLRSGVCVALNYVDINSRSRGEREALVETMHLLFRDARDGGTHSAADWTLRKWQFDPPAIDRCESKEDFSAWTNHHDWYVNSLGQTMLKIPAGKFVMGSPDDDEAASDSEKPLHEVELNEFWLSDREVTVGLFRAVMEDGSANAGPPDASKEELPVTGVSWFDAVEFCIRLSEHETLSPYYELTNVQRNFQRSIENADIRLLEGDGYRLPTEAEWEYACRAKSGRHFCFGDDDLANPRLLSEYAWFTSNSSYRRGICASKIPNGWGLFDLHGNVLEWCWDWYDDDYYSASKRTSEQNRRPVLGPQGPIEGSRRVNRGGAWNYSAKSCRSALRDSYKPAHRLNFRGFRIARSSVSTSAYGEFAGQVETAKTN